MLQSDLGEPVDERAVGTALWSVLSAQAQSGPVLIALDDLPFMDAASAGALRFALRRLGQASPVRLVATARGGDSRWAPLDGLPVHQVLSVGVGPVTVGALFELLAARLAVRLARPVLLRVHVTCGGNPLYALELARALDRLEIVPRPGVPLPVPTSLDGLVAERVRSLPPDVLRSPRRRRRAAVHRRRARARRGRARGPGRTRDCRRGPGAGGWSADRASSGRHIR